MLIGQNRKRRNHDLMANRQMLNVVHDELYIFSKRLRVGDAVLLVQKASA